MADIRKSLNINIDGGAPNSNYFVGGGSFQFRRGTAANWTAANPTLLQGEVGFETDTSKFKVGDGTTVWSSLTYGGLIGPTTTNVLESYGDGSDGNVTVSSGTTTLARDMFYNNLTMSGTGKIVSNGWRIFVAGILDITASAAGALQWNGNDGSASATSTGGVIGATLSGNTVGGSGAATAGKTGVAGAGVNSTGSGAQTANGGTGGSSGNGGTGSGGAGGTGTTSGALTSLPIRRWETDLLLGVTLILGGIGGTGGASGSGNGTNAGGGGGGGGGAAGVLAIYAKTINRSGTTAANTFQANGGLGGAGGTANATGATKGGGGGASGGGGGWIYLVYDTLTGSTATNALQASGGTGGAGGTPTGGNAGGNGGGGGGGGRITLLKVTTSVGSDTTGAAGTAGSAASGATGGAGGAGNNFQVSL